MRAVLADDSGLLATHLDDDGQKQHGQHEHGEQEHGEQEQGKQEHGEQDGEQEQEHGQKEHGHDDLSVTSPMERPHKAVETDAATMMVAPHCTCCGLPEMLARLSSARQPALAFAAESTESQLLQRGT